MTNSRNYAIIKVIMLSLKSARKQSNKVIQTNCNVLWTSRLVPCHESLDESIKKKECGYNKTLGFMLLQLTYFLTALVAAT